MGLSASQIRYLNLTGRKNEVEYAVQQLTYQQTELTKLTQKVAKDYNDKMNNMKFVYNTYNANGDEVKKTLTYELVTGTAEDGGMNMRIVDKNGNVVVPSLPQDTEYIKAKDKNTGEYTKFTDTNAFISEFMPGISEEEYETIKDYTFSALKAYWESSAYYNENYILNILTSVRSDMKGADERYLIDKQANDPSYFYDKLVNGDWKIEQHQTSVVSGVKTWEDIESFESLSISQVLNTDDDAAAEATYDAEMAKINTQQKQLDYQLKQLDTEHEALVKELDSVLEVINNNIENSYNKFSS